MDPLTIAAASGLRARLESLEMLANNLANANTAGYKADREFYTLYTASEAAEAGSMSGLPEIASSWTDHAQGVLTATGGSYDVALEGAGFLGVNGPDGILYTRSGTLHLNGKGELVTRDGYALRNAADGKPIRLDVALPFELTAEGSVRQSGGEIARLEISNFPQPSALTKRGGNYFHMTDPAVRPVRSAAEVHQGKIEASNSSSAESAIRLVSVLRQFEMLQRALALGGEMGRKSVEEVARVA